MGTTFSFSESNTFTVVHARHIASKVATDLKRFQRFYGSPSDGWIDLYEGELIALLTQDVLSDVVYGFKRNGMWTQAAVRYVAANGGVLAADDDPGKIRPGFDITGANFTSFLVYNDKWNRLTESARQGIQATYEMRRTTGDTPGLENGHWADDLNYFAGGRGLGRSVVRK